MNEREELELAALAAGIRHIEYSNDYDGAEGLMLCDEIGRHTRMWSPKHNDGDAFRLMVACGISVVPYPIYEQPKLSVIAQRKTLPRPTEDAHLNLDDVEKIIAIAPYSDNPAAATRLAIVKAAAAIGRKMKEGGK